MNRRPEAGSPIPSQYRVGAFEHADDPAFNPIEYFLSTAEGRRQLVSAEYWSL
jgi:hypothetical protein